jgi:hypothetical protein
MGFVLQRVNIENIMKIRHAIQTSEMNLFEDIYDTGVQSFSNYAVVMNFGGLNPIKNISYYPHNMTQPFKISY